jgi:hypothetical protein
MQDEIDELLDEVDHGGGGGQLVGGKKKAGSGNCLPGKGAT